MWNLVIANENELFQRDFTGELMERYSKRNWKLINFTENYNYFLTQGYDVRFDEKQENIIS